MPNIYFTSDQHYGHKNIITYCNRPFKTVPEMDEAMITNYNSRVRPEDTVYHLGDFSFGDPKKYLSKLNGRKYLILGNHDRYDDHANIGWEWIKQYFELRVGDNRVVLFHYPMKSWNKAFHGSYHCFGHVHNKVPPYFRARDIGVDTHNFFPISIDEVIESLKNNPSVPDETY